MSTIPNNQIASCQNNITEISFNNSKFVADILNNLTKIVNLNENLTQQLNAQRHAFDEIFKQSDNMYQQLANTVAELSKIQYANIKEIKNTAKIQKCLDFLKMNEWPLFLFINEELYEYLQPYIVENNIDSKGISNVLLNYLSEEMLLEICNDWSDLLSINTPRLPVLKESVKLFQLGYYYGCTSLLMCQVEGIISDIYYFCKNSGLQFTDADIKEAYKYLLNRELQDDKIKKGSEKNQILALINTLDIEGLVLWLACIEYIYKIILTSKKDMENSVHPCRNKICHGIQLNFGTREHAVKSILVIDSLIKFEYKLHNMLQKQQ